MTNERDAAIADEATRRALEAPVCGTDTVKQAAFEALRLEREGWHPPEPEPEPDDADKIWLKARKIYLMNPRKDSEDHKAAAAVIRQALSEAEARGARSAILSIAALNEGNQS